jgi:tetratricopeptide (TPR) repeat protein
MASMRSSSTADQPPSSPPPNAFIGRERELNDLATALQSHRLVTITGTGGVGKTRLAMELISQSAPGFPDGVHIVRLAAIRDEAGAVQEIAQALHISGSAELLDRDIRNALSRGRHLLLLDNLEHLDLRNIVASFLADCPDLSILVTSRRPLHVEGEWIVKLDPFQIGRSLRDDESTLREEPAVDLFCRRAGESPRSVQILDGQLPDVAEICRRVDGLPLAIELAVGWMRLLTPEELLAYLDQVLPRLRGVVADDDERHQTMASTIKWSYDLLTPDEQRFFRRLSAFAGGFTIYMAERMAAGHSGVACYPFADGFNRKFEHPGYHGEDPTITGDFPEFPELALSPIEFDVIDGLQSLDEVGLIQRVESSDGDSRYDLLEVIREFGQNQLASNGELDPAFHLQTAITLAMVEIWHEGIFVPALQPWSHARMNQELPNLRQALTWSIGRGEMGVDLSQRLTGSTWMFWQYRGLIAEGRRWTEASYSFETSTWSQDMKMSALGFLCWIQGDDARAEEVLLEGVERAGKASYVAAEASGYLYLALVEWRRGTDHLPRMIDRVNHAMELYQSVQDLAGISICTLVLGIIDRLTGEPLRALERFEKSLFLATACNFEWGVASSTYYAADATLELATQDPARFPKALDLFEKALNGYVEHGDWWGTGGVTGGVATAAVYLGDQETAARLFGLSTALLGVVGAFLPPANLEFYQAIANHLREQMGDERFVSNFSAGMTIEVSDAPVEIQQAIDALRLRIAQMASGSSEPLPKLTAIQKRAVQGLVDGFDPQTLAGKLDRSEGAMYQLLGRICERWNLSTWEELAPLAVSRGYLTPTPKQDKPSRQGWSK